jgi:isopentenyl-diphosphate delta-isomerase type 1
MNDQDEQVVLVDRLDQPLGVMDKLQAHVEGRLHRAFSVFIFDKQDRLLLQQRALHKYHTPGLWTNTCCSHPRQGEDTEHAALRRLGEEMGIREVELIKAFTYYYEAPVGQHLVEHELDHVWVGCWEGEVHSNPEEVHQTQWITAEDLDEWIQKEPNVFTPWFKGLNKKVYAFWTQTLRSQ